MLIVYGLDGDPEIAVVAVTAPYTDIPEAVKTIVGIGYPYYAFASLPFDFGNGIVADFSLGKICNNSRLVNLADINTMINDPNTYLPKVSAA